MSDRFAPNRVEAARRLERARQVVRERSRYGFPVTRQHLGEVIDAEEAYDLATALVSPHR